METNQISLLEHAHVTEMEEKLQKKLNEAQRREAGRIDGMRKRILGHTVSENYETAKETLNSFVFAKSDFPQFQRRVQRYIDHCLELVDAIQMKRNFPGFSSLSLSKQQDIHEKIIGHFEELKIHLRQIEKMEREYRLVDSSSTVWILRAFVFWMFAIFGAALLLELTGGLMETAFNVASVFADEAGTWIVTRMGF